MMKLAGKGDNLEKNKEQILQVIYNGSAFKKLVQLVDNQGGDVSYIYHIDQFETATYVLPVLARKSGRVVSLKAEEVGKLSVFLGAGRICKEDQIDSSVGIVLEKKMNEVVEEGEVLAYIHANDKEKGEEAVRRLEEIYKIEI